MYNYRLKKKRSVKKNRVITLEKLMIYVIFPIMVIGLGYLLNYYLSKMTEPETGKLLVQTDFDSVEVFVNGESIGITRPVSTSSQDIFILNAKDIYPGSYNIMLKKKSMLDAAISDVEIKPGYLTSVSKLFRFSLFKSQLIKDSLKIIPKYPEPTKDIKVKENSYQTEIKSDDNTHDKTITKYTLSINLSEEIKPEKTSLYINSFFMGSPSSHYITVELEGGLNEIFLTYIDDLGIKYGDSISRNITSDDIINIYRKDFILIRK